MHDIPTKPIILVVDDDPTILRLLNEIMSTEYHPYLAPSGERALVFLEKMTPDLILLDLEMPGMNGYDVLRAINANPAWSEIPVIFLTAQEGRDKEKEALSLGAVDYILKPISPDIVRYRVGLQVELQAYTRNPEHMPEVRTSQLKRTPVALIDTPANITSFRANETRRHDRPPSFYAKAHAAKRLVNGVGEYKIDDSYAEGIIKAARLHDIGKVAVPDNILLKPARLTPFEFELIKQHSVYGAEIMDMAIEGLGEDETSYFLTVAREIIATHHEKWDGSGYPLGLSGKDIPLSGRILAIVDVYDALISHRPYKPRYRHEEALNMILSEKGTHFDPELLDFSMEVLENFKYIAEDHQD